MNCGSGAYDTKYDDDTIKTLEECACKCNEIGCVKFQFESTTSGYSICKMKNLSWLNGMGIAEGTALDPPTQVCGKGDVYVRKGCEKCTSRANCAACKGGWFGCGFSIRMQ